MKTCTVDGAPVAYTDVGQGSVLLFVHGIYVTGALWNDLTAQLSDRFRCIAPTWPLGAQDQLAGDADVGAAASARRIAHFVEQLDLDEVTIVANDTGGGLVLTMLGDQTLDLSWIGGLVLTNCDGPVALTENGRDEAAIASPSDGEGEFGEGRCEPIFGSVSEPSS